MKVVKGLEFEILREEGVRTLIVDLRRIDVIMNDKYHPKTFLYDFDYCVLNDEWYLIETAPHDVRMSNSYYDMYLPKKMVDEYGLDHIYTMILVNNQLKEDEEVYLGRWVQA